MTADPDGALSIAWNAIDLPRTITSGTGTSSVSTQRGYLADGSLAQVSDGSTTRLYFGDMVFNKAANGTVTLESAGWEGGRLLPGSGSDKILYVVKDHLGSVRVVKDGTGAIRQRFDYYPYGTVSRIWTSSATTDNSEKRYRFSGKEVSGSGLTDLTGMGVAPGAPYLDFGARVYTPRTAAWLSQDPMTENYYSISPYVYCAGNPVNQIDPNGMEGVRTIDENGNVTITSNVVVLMEKQLEIPEDASKEQASRINNKNERIAKRNQTRLETVAGYLSEEYSSTTTSEGKTVSFVFTIIPFEVAKPQKTTLSEARAIALENGIKGVETGRRPGEFGYDVALAAVIGQGSSGGHLGLTTGYVLITANDFSSRTIAHEIGHTFKLKDNYPNHDGGLMDYPANPLSSSDVDMIIKKAYVKK